MRILVCFGKPVVFVFVARKRGVGSLIRRPTNRSARRFVLVRLQQCTTVVYLFLTSADVK